MFHHFHIEGERPPAQGSITTSDLRNIIDYVGREHILPAWDWQDKAINHALGEEDLCLTFDDALKSQIELALPVLEEYDLTAFWFIYSSVFLDHKERFEIYKCFYNQQFVDFDSFYRIFKNSVMDSDMAESCRSGLKDFRTSNYLNDFGFYSDTEREYRFVRDHILGPEYFGLIMDQLMQKNGVDPEGLSEELWMNNDDLVGLSGAGHVVGLHSFSHPTDLKSMSIDEQEKEYKSNKEHIREVTGEDTLAMSHPCNSYSEDTLRLLNNMGIKVGFRSNRMKGEHSNLEYPREDHINIMAELSLANIGCKKNNENQQS